MAETNSTGLCQCGCGLPAPISPITDQNRGYIKGQPRKFIFGHNGKTQKSKIESGQRYGRLMVLRRKTAVEPGQSSFKWVCLCDCGNTTELFSGNLTSGNTRSCGCLSLDSMRRRMTVHGHYKSPEYRTWRGMIERCSNPNAIGYKHYGGRGIEVCDRWRKFENFLADMGERPADTSIDRIDVNGNYEPVNCRWATRSQQSRNKRPTKRPARARPITWGGVTRPLRDWADALGINRDTLRHRHKNGQLPPELFRPTEPRGGHRAPLAQRHRR